MNIKLLKRYRKLASKKFWMETDGTEYKIKVLSEKGEIQCLTSNFSWANNDIFLLEPSNDKPFTFISKWLCENEPFVSRMFEKYPYEFKQLKIDMEHGREWRFASMWYFNPTNKEATMDLLDYLRCCYIQSLAHYESYIRKCKKEEKIVHKIKKVKY